MTHSFGGSWTDEKLVRIGKYLDAYMTIFTSNPKAALLNTTYLDAFAGTGFYEVSEPESPSHGPLFEDALSDPDTKSLKSGSAHVALNRDPAFNRYVFIERNPDHAEKLEDLRLQFPDLSERISIEVADANSYLQRWCKGTNWAGNRAVVFLDPYGMQVDWTTIEAIADTRAIDLWILFPLGQAVNRLLTRNELPKGGYAEKLTRFFGTDEWKEAFYEQSPPPAQPSFFDESSSEDFGFAKRTNFESIGNFFVERLEGVFADVAKKPFPLRNKKGVPLYLLCFAAANPIGARTAIKIANDLLKNV